MIKNALISFYLLKDWWEQMRRHFYVDFERVRDYGQSTTQSHSFFLVFFTKTDFYIIIYDSIEVEHSAGFEPQVYPE